MIYTVSMPMTYDEIIKLLSVVHLGKPLKFKNACEYAIEIIKEYEKIKADEQAEEYAMSNDFYNGMLKFEQLCEKLLVESDLKEETQIYIQTAILDKAQAIIEALEEE